MIRSFLFLAILAQSVSAASPLKDALTFHASFDEGVYADFSKGDPNLRTLVKRKPEQIVLGLQANGAAKHVRDQGKKGGALHFTRKETPWLYFKAEDNVPYQKQQWTGSISAWMKLDPEEDLEPGYCDPIQVTTRAWNDGAFFVDFDKEGDPRDFRLGAFADLSVWNPNKADVPEDKRPLLKVSNPPFSKDQWTHVAFTWKNFNSGEKDGVAVFYLNGKKQGEITGWNQQFTWKDDEEARLYIGINYIGLFDELSCFNRALTDEEIQSLYQTPIELTEEPVPEPAVKLDVSGPGWEALGGDDFVNVNCKEDTWHWKEGEAYCTGDPVGVIRLKEPVTNLEMSVEWKHLSAGGNSGVFLWASPESIKNLEQGKGRLPSGIEVQMLDHGYTEKYERNHKKPADWFTTNGDVFPTGPAKMKPFPPVAPNGTRSFPSKNVSRGVGKWNHYYIRAINGEVRLWVNGEEVSGGTDCQPATGYLCLESEGAPVMFRNIRLRRLP